MEQEREEQVDDGQLCNWRAVTASTRTFQRDYPGGPRNDRMGVDELSSNQIFH